MIELKISCFDIMLNFRLFQKVKLLGYGKFNHLTNTSNNTYAICCYNVLMQFLQTLFFSFLFLEEWEILSLKTLQKIWSYNPKVTPMLLKLNKTSFILDQVEITPLHYNPELKYEKNNKQCMKPQNTLLRPSQLELILKFLSTSTRFCLTHNFLKFPFAPTLFLISQLIATSDPHSSPTSHDFWHSIDSTLHPKLVCIRKPFFFF